MWAVVLCYFWRYVHQTTVQPGWLVVMLAANVYHYLSPALQQLMDMFTHRISPCNCCQHLQPHIGFCHT